MTKLLARLVIVGAAQTLEEDWRFLVHLREKRAAFEVGHSESEGDPRKQYVMQEGRKAIVELEAEANVRITAATNAIHGLAIAMQYLEDEEE